MFDSMFPSHWTTLRKLMWLKLKGASAVWETISGNPVSFTAKAAPLRKLQIAFSPVQAGSGDPSPTNVRPISGWDSLHVYDDPLYAGVIEWNQLVQNGNFADTSVWTEYEGTLTVEGNVATVTSNNSNIPFIYQAVECKAGHKYYISCDVRSDYYSNGYFYWDGGGLAKAIAINQNWKTEAIIYTGTGSGINLSFRGRDAQNGWTFQQRNFIACDLTQMFGAGNEPATVEAFKALFPHDYYPYNAGTETLVGTVNGMDTRSISISLGSTVYSGWVDAVTGIGESKDPLEDLGGYNWELIDADMGLFRTTATGISAQICDTYPVVVTTSFNAMQDKAIRNHSNRIYVKDSTYAGITAAEFKTAVTGIKFINPNATPIPIQLTPQQVSSLLGENNMWSDANGNLTVTFAADPATLPIVGKGKVGQAVI